VRCATPGWQVTGRSQAGTTPVAAQLLSRTIPSPTIGQLAALTAGPSDDFFAEMLLKALGARFGAGRHDGGRRERHEQLPCGSWG